MSFAPFPPLGVSKGQDTFDEYMLTEYNRAIAIVALIARSKLVPDFALTIQALHLIFTTLYSRSLPRNMMWWLCAAASSAVCVALGMWGCQWRELQPVFFGGGRILGNNAPPPGTTQSGGRDEEEGKGESFEMEDRR